jgi:acyl-CoA thioesterase II
MTADAVPIFDGGDIAELLGLTPLAGGGFRSRSGERNEHGRIFGGQLLGQALAAARRTAPVDRQATYLQFLFLAGGLPDRSVDYQVTTLQEGKRFSSRHVRGAQADGRLICDASVSFALPIEGPAFQVPAPEGLALDPDTLPELDAIAVPGAHEVERMTNYEFQPHAAIDFRPAFIEDFNRVNQEEPRMRFFIRLRKPMADDPALHEAAFAYLSDFWINFVACVPHVEAMAQANARLYVASLNHAIWFHRPLRADEWLFFDCRNPSGAFGRGLSVARVYAKSGELVASATQECLLAPL